MSKIIITGSILILSLGLASCKKTAENESVSMPQTFVKALYSEPLTYDPIKMNDTASLVFSNLIYDGLLKFSPYMEIKPSLAESWQTDESGKNIKFTLRSNALFHNGGPVKAIDVVYSFTRAVSKESTVYKYYDCIEGATEYHDGKAKTVIGLQALNDKTVLIKLKYPFPPFLSVLAGGSAKILPHDLVKDPNFFKAPVGAGAYKFVSTSKVGGQTDVTLSKFEKYYADVKLDKIVLRAVDEKIAHAQAAKGEIQDLANFPLMGTEAIFKAGKKVDSPAAWTWIIGMNSRLTPFKDKNVRIAFSQSVDTEKFRKTFYPDAIPAYGYVPPGMPGYKIKADPKENVNIAIPKDKIKILFPSELAQQKEMRAFIEANLKEHGWNVEVVASDWATLMKGYDNKTLQGFVVAMNIDYPDTEFLARNFESTNPDNFSGLKDPQIDSLLHKARLTQDRIERDKIYAKVMGLIDDATVSVNLFHPRSHYWISNCVLGFEPNLLSDVYIDYAQVSLKKNCDTSQLEAAR